MKVLAYAASTALVVLGLTVSGAAQGQTMKGHLMDIACSSHHATEAGYTESRVIVTVSPMRTRVSGFFSNSSR